MVIICPPALRQRLPAAIGEEVEIVTLPVEARNSDVYDIEFRPDDVVLSMDLTRPGGKLPRVALLQLPGAGTDRIDLDALAPETSVCNVFEHEIPIAEFVLAAMLEWEIRIADLRAMFTAESWPGLSRARGLHGELYGKTLGVVGFGRIGREAAKRAAAFGMTVLAVARRPDGGPADEVHPTAALADVLPRCDYVLDTLPLDEATRGIFDGPMLARMKPTGVIINVGRGQTIDEEALFTALSQKTIGGAILDVWYQYARDPSETPPPSRFDFFSLDNVILTPHASAVTGSLWDRRAATIAENFRRLERGEPLLNVVRAGTR
ncbi:2-hydroxyacid dehydrogenase [Acuticoccus sp. I52.16.1]|uniref:2-hydroxyacid dehydrogenase n=1 Tax=Acuticoccus sp. I52.16.1 TaxID=2928472 RepID=UPI001FCFD075|nr:2-hydroxyacid dehydrogenase [Acuticoccus sp. I52.16.1]UOM33802.1 2-hydroxyacid dehydrogenase [Acuticoccus sp. I52.16.1]